MTQSPDLRPAVPPQPQPQETGLVPSRLIRSENVSVASGVLVIAGAAGAINPTEVAPVDPQGEHVSGEVVDGKPGATDDTVEFNRGLYLPTTELAPWAGRNEQPPVVWEPGERIGDKPGAWIDPKKDDVKRIMAAWPERVMQRIEAMRRRGMLPASLDSHGSELKAMHQAADTTLAISQRAVTEALDPTDEYGILPFARQAGAAVVNKPADVEALPSGDTNTTNWITSPEAASDAVPTPQAAEVETHVVADDAELTAAELAAVEAAVSGDTLSPETLAILLAEPSAPPAPTSPAPRATGEETRAISWATQAQGGDGAEGSWMMPQRKPAENLPTSKTKDGDGYVSVMADIEIPDGVRKAFGEQKPMSPAEFDERMTQLNAERNFLEKALSDGAVAPEDLANTKARLAVVMQKESDLLARGTGGKNGSDNSLETMQRVLSGLRKI